MYRAVTPVRRNSDIVRYPEDLTAVIHVAAI
jgi:hypothetical protein